MNINFSLKVLAHLNYIFILDEYILSDFYYERKNFNLLYVQFSKYAPGSGSWCQ